MEKLKLSYVRAWRPTVSKRTLNFYNYTYKLYKSHTTVLCGLNYSILKVVLKQHYPTI